jgi:hypothetical protein
MAPSSSLTAWSYFSAGTLALLASALILFPRLLLFLSQSGAEERSTLTSLEAFLALHFGIYLVAVAATLILNVRNDQPFRFLADDHVSLAAAIHKPTYPLERAFGSFPSSSGPNHHCGDLVGFYFLEYK